MVVKTLLTLLFLTSVPLLPTGAETMVAPDSVARRLAAVPDAQIKATALIFLAPDCPISNALVPEMNRLVEKYTPLGVVFFFVYAERDLADIAAAKHARDFGLIAPVTVDRAGVLTAKAGVKVTPEAAVFSREGSVLYRGRINDLFAALGKKRTEPTTNDLREALDAILAGKAPPVASSPAIGCYISTKP